MASGSPNVKVIATAATVTGIMESAKQAGTSSSSTQNCSQCRVAPGARNGWKCMRGLSRGLFATVPGSGTDYS